MTTAAALPAIRTVVVPNHRIVEVAEHLVGGVASIIDGDAIGPVQVSGTIETVEAHDDHVLLHVRLKGSRRRQFRDRGVRTSFRLAFGWWPDAGLRLDTPVDLPESAAEQVLRMLALKPTQPTPRPLPRPAVTTKGSWVDARATLFVVTGGSAHLLTRHREWTNRHGVSFTDWEAACGASSTTNWFRPTARHNMPAAMICSQCDRSDRA